MTARALALCLAASLCSARTDKISTEVNSEKLAKSLRRQLVQNNYDYMSSESQESPRSRTDYRKHLHRYEKPLIEGPSSHRHYSDIYEEKYRRNINIKSNKKTTNKNSGNIDLKDDSSVVNSNIESIDEELKDIVQGKVATRKKEPGDIFTVEDEEENRHKYEDKTSHEDNYFIDTQQLHNHNHQNIQTTTAKYKIIKVNKSYRRSGSPDTLIQEETPDSVSVVNVGGGPFPEFRLPRARRQYMHLPGNIGVIDEDDEIPPPPVNDTYTAIEDTEPKGNDKLINILHAGANSNKEAQNMSLVITVTPDEIFVL